MRFYTSQHGFYCGVDLHARTMYVCVLDQAGDAGATVSVRVSPESSKYRTTLRLPRSGLM